LSALQEPLRAFDRLAISNHQMSSYVPWSVLCRHLQWRGVDRGFLPVTTVPSLRMLGRFVQKPAPTLSPLVVGDPLGDLSFAAAEARAVAETFGVEPLIGADATAQAVGAALCEAKVIHFVGHGALSLGRDPVALRLTDGELSARDILQSRPRAKLVVLSACWSGFAVKATREEFFGLAEAFLLAGVDCVIAALWEINDEVSPMFFRKFYRRWLAGADPAEALRDAIDEVASQPKWKHPHWWGALTVRGRSRAKESHQGESHVD
jgi:CHAT domain-containing protein